MKFVRHGEKGKEKPGVVADDGTIRDLTSFVKDITGYELAHKLDDLRKLDFKTYQLRQWNAMALALGILANSCVLA